MRLTVNGQPVTADPPGSATLLDLLRDTLALTGTKRACDRGVERFLARLLAWADGAS